MARASLQFGGYQPDQPPLTEGIVTVAENVLPSVNGYLAMPSFVPVSGATLAARPEGGISIRGSDRVSRVFAGTETNIYKLGASGWASVGSGYYARSNGWSFVQYSDRLIATNGVDPVQKLDLMTDAAFSPLPGNPPTLAYVAVVGGFLFGGVANGEAQTVVWSGNQNSELWTPGVGESDFQPLPDGGTITGVTGGEFALIFQQDCIRRADYVAGRVIFDINVISPSVGCVAPRSLVQVGQVSYFYSNLGFMRTDGAGVTPIGDQRVDLTFRALADAGQLRQMSAVSDPVNKVIIWTVPDADPDLWFCYSWAVDRWSVVRQPARLLFSGLSRTATLEELDALAPPDMDGAGVTVDEPQFLGGAPQLYCIDDLNRLGTFSGAKMAAKIAVPLLEPSVERSVQVSRVRPLTDAISGMTLRMDGRLRIGDAPSLVSRTELTRAGDMPVLVQGRYMGAQIEVAAGTSWTFLRGMNLEFEPQGFML
jgi:hypothetical protein